MINFYCEDVLTAMQKIPSWDLVICDAPSLDDMKPADSIRRLAVALNSGSENSLLLYYGYNIDNCIRLVDRAGWQIRNTYTLYVNGHNGDVYSGCVVQAGSSSQRRPGHQRWLDRMPPSISVTPKGKRTQKAKDWFLPFISIGKYSHCLDMYCGEGGAEVACQEIGLDCSAVDISPSSIKKAKKLLASSLAVQL